MTIFRDNRALLDAFRRGEPWALTRVYEKYLRQVETVVRRGAMGIYEGPIFGAPRQEWRDLVQETFTRAFSEGPRQRFDGLRDYQPFLLAIARHVLVDYWRKRGREVLPGEIIEVAAPEEMAPPPELEAVQKYLAGLEPALKDVHEQRYVRGVSQLEAAVALGLTRQKIRTLEDKLRKGLKKFLQRR